MTKPYEKRLEAIRELLANPSQELVQEGYGLLFKLWLENADNSLFIQELIPIALEFQETVREIEIRLGGLSVNDTITDTFLRTHLMKFALEVEKVRLERSNSPEKKDRVEEMELRTPKIFISYSHRDETYKDELVTILTPLQDEGVLEIWQDREIMPGDEWYEAIQDAMNSCNLALLLISADFLTSRFIRDKELTRLLERRKQEGLRVVPIIVRQCMWQSKSVLKDIQALPRDGKAISSFEDRDQIWTDIGRVIENLIRQFH